MNDLRICVLTSQYFGWGTYGGFGSMSRKLAESLAQEGLSVSVIVPRRLGQAPVERIRGVEVRSFSPFSPVEACDLIRDSSADIFHSQDPTVLTYLAQKLQPRRVHLVTCRDPRTWKDWLIEFAYATNRRRLLTPVHYATESGFLVGQAVRNAHGVYCPAHFLRSKVQRMFRLRRTPGHLPNLIDVPALPPEKSQTPTIAYIARWDKRKRPGLFLDLARDFPLYRFIAVGGGSALAESGFDADLRKKYVDVPNLEMTGFIDRFREPERIRQILSDTWVFVNTAIREGLPLTFLEAAAHGCSLLSAADPDGLTSRFGRVVTRGGFSKGLADLMADSPLLKGREALHYVADAYGDDKALASHIELYRSFSRSHVMSLAKMAALG
jgi:glycosyltransferase involved in cell wall biosynthesis